MRRRAAVVNRGPLAGIRILEAGTMLAGPYATMMLADLGAEVTKIEPPGGDISRTVSEAHFAILNRGKRSVCLDLTTEAGRLQLGELVAHAPRRPQPDLTSGPPACARRESGSNRSTNSPNAQTD